MARLLVRVLSVLVLGLVAFGVSRLGPEAPPAMVADQACTCERERERNGFCEACGVGYVAGVQLPTRRLYEVVDAHGHDIDPALLECASCRANLPVDGYCTTCNRGFVAGQAYATRLGYHLALGEPEAVEQDLEVVRAALRERDRCERCAAAMLVDGDCSLCRLRFRRGVRSSL